MSKLNNLRKQGLTLTDVMNTTIGHTLTDEEASVELAQKDATIAEWQGNAYAQSLLFVGCQPTSLALLIPDDYDQAHMETLLNSVYDMSKTLNIYIGDIAVFASEKLGYGDEAALAERLGIEAETLYLWKSICKKVKTLTRIRVWTEVQGRQPLTLTHFRYVMNLSDDEQYKYLSFAYKNGWSTRRLKSELEDDGIKVEDESKPAKADRPVHVEALKWLERYPDPKSLTPSLRGKAKERLDALQGYIISYRRKLEE